METRFSTLIREILRNENLNLMQLYKELYDLGMPITYASLYAYYTGTVIPPFDVAKRILKLEKISISDSELQEILKFSKKEFRKENKEINKIVNLNLKIKPENIDINFKNNPNSLKSLIEMRSNELFGNEDLVTQFSAVGKRKISAYVAYLIKNDLQENGFIEEEEHETN